MKVYRSIENVPRDPDSFVTLGTFDGIHLGHQKIIQTLLDESRRNGGRSVLVTFYPHPKTVIKSAKPPIEILTPLDEKEKILRSFGLDVMVVLNFSKALSRIKPDVFVREYLSDAIGVKKLIIGYNHAFGRDRAGGIGLLHEEGEKLGFSLQVIPPVHKAGDVVSSTRIRRLIKQGDILTANSLLGRHYTLEGTVHTGSQLGARMGFPTANIYAEDSHKCIPGDGVYAVFIHRAGNTYQGMANVGFSPTLKGNRREVEVHLFDFSQKIYQEKLTIEFVHRLRSEQSFKTVDDLVDQIKQDQKRSMDVLSKEIRRQEWG
jgi:riboflavin kinase/FMN adenylyltransferase